MSARRMFIGVVISLLWSGGVALPASATAPADTAAYTIQLVRPRTVGEQYSISAITRQTNAMRLEIDDKESEKDAHEFKYEFEGTATITGVDDKGRESKLHVVIKKFTRSEGGAAAADVLQPGAQIDCTYKEGNADFSQANGKLSDAALGALAAVFAAPPRKTNDEMFGTAGKKMIGENWPVNIPAVVEDAGQRGMSLDPRKIQGTAKLVAAAPLAGVPCVSVEINIEAADLSIPPMGKAKESSNTITALMRLPVDLANPSHATQTTNQLHAVFENQRKDFKMVTTIDSTEIRQLTEIWIK